MNSIRETRLQRFWLATATASLLFPLYLYRADYAANEFTGTMTVFLAIIFVLALPFSLCSLPLVALFTYGIELVPNTLFGAYFHVVLLNIFGYLQWYWLLPTYFDRGKEFKLPTILGNN